MAHSYTSALFHCAFSTKHADFCWQEGYGAFSIGISHMEQTVAYIRSQKEHHRTKTFQEEFVGFLKRHGIQYDERYIWD